VTSELNIFTLMTLRVVIIYDVQQRDLKVLMLPLTASHVHFNVKSFSLIHEFQFLLFLVLLLLLYCYIIIVILLLYGYQEPTAFPEGG